MALYTATVAAFRMLAAPLWGRALDPGGARPVLVSSAFALGLSPLLWIFAAEGRLWPLAIDAAMSGAANAGLSLATFSLPLALSRPSTRSFYVGALAAAGGLAAGIGSAAGGVFVKFLPDAWSLLGQPLVSAHALFLAGATRACAPPVSPCASTAGRRRTSCRSPPGGGRACEAVGVSFDCRPAGMLLQHG